MNADVQLREELAKCFQTKDVVELFEMLDVDGSGTVQIAEFCEHLIKLSASAVPVEHVRTMKQLGLIRGDVKKESTHIQRLETRTRSTETCVKNSAARISRLETRVDEIHDMLRALVAPPGSITLQLQPRSTHIDGPAPAGDDGSFSPLGRSLQIGTDTPQTGSAGRYRFQSDASMAAGLLARTGSIPEDSPVMQYAAAQPAGSPMDEGNMMRL
jgi:hypothetical protein